MNVHRTSEANGGNKDLKQGFAVIRSQSVRVSVRPADRSRHGTSSVRVSEPARRAVTNRTGKRSRAGRPFAAACHSCGLVAVCKDFCLEGETFLELAGVAGKTCRVSVLAPPPGANQFAAVLSGSARPHRD